MATPPRQLKAPPPFKKRLPARAQKAPDPKQRAEREKGKEKEKEREGDKEEQRAADAGAVTVHSIAIPTAPTSLMASLKPNAQDRDVVAALQRVRQQDRERLAARKEGPKQPPLVVICPLDKYVSTRATCCALWLVSGTLHQVAATRRIAAWWRRRGTPAATSGADQPKAGSDKPQRPALGPVPPSQLASALVHIGRAIACSDSHRRQWTAAWRIQQLFKRWRAVRQAIVSVEAQIKEAEQRYFQDDLRWAGLRVRTLRVRGTQAQTAQIGAIIIRSGGHRVDQVQSLSGEHVGRDTASNVFDNSRETKWQGPVGSAVTVKFNEPMTLDAFALVTAFDAPHRDPVLWHLELSVDGNAWLLAHIGRQAPHARCVRGQWVTLTQMSRLIPAASCIQRAWRVMSARKMHANAEWQSRKRELRMAEEATAWLAARDDQWAVLVLQRALRCVYAKIRCDEIRRERWKQRRAQIIAEWHASARVIQVVFRRWHEWKTSTLAAAVVLQAWWRLNHVRRRKRHRKAARIMVRALRKGVTICKQDRAARRIQLHWNLFRRRVMTTHRIKQWVLEGELLSHAAAIRLSRALRGYCLRAGEARQRQEIRSMWALTASRVKRRVWAEAPPNVPDGQAAEVLSVHLCHARRTWRAESAAWARLVKLARAERFELRPKRRSLVPPRALAAMATLRRASRCVGRGARPTVSMAALDALVCHTSQMQPLGDLPPRPPVRPRAATGRPLWMAGAAGELECQLNLEGGAEGTGAGFEVPTPSPPPRPRPPPTRRPHTAPRKRPDGSTWRPPRMSPFTDTIVRSPPRPLSPARRPVPPSRPQSAWVVAEAAPAEAVAVADRARDRPHSAAAAWRGTPARNRPAMSARPRRRPLTARQRETGPSHPVYCSRLAEVALSGWDPKVMRDVQVKYWERAEIRKAERLEATARVSATHATFARALRS